MSVYKWNSTGSITLDDQECRKMEEEETRDNGAIYRGQDGEDDVVLVVKPSENNTSDVNFLPKFTKNRRPARYKSSVQHLIPVRKKAEDPGIFPIQSAGLCSYLSTSWLTGLMWKGYRQGLVVKDIWRLPACDSAEANLNRLKYYWEAEISAKGKENASLFCALLRTIRTRLFVAMLCMVIGSFFQFLGPTWLLKRLLSYVGREEAVQISSSGGQEEIEGLYTSLEYGLALVILLVVFQLSKILSMAAMQTMSIHTGARMTGALQLMVYHRLLTLRASAASTDQLYGKLNTIVTNDVERVYEAIAMAPMIMNTPVIFILCLGYSVYVMGPWALLGLLVILISLPILSGIAAMVGRIRRETVPYTEARVGLTREILSSVRLIKSYVWEEPFAKKVLELRKPEHQRLRKAAFYQSITMVIISNISVIAAVITFLGFSLAGNNFSAPEVFTVLSLFGAFQFALGTLPHTVRCVAEAVVCLGRMRKLLLMSSPPPRIPEYPREESNALELEEVTFVVPVVIREEEEKAAGGRGRDKKKKKKDAGLKRRNELVENGITEEMQKLTVESASSGPKEGTMVVVSKPNELGAPGEITEVAAIPVKKATFDVRKGALVGVTGGVGSGKSCLLAGIAGELSCTTGHFRVSGSIAMVSQTGWIFNETIRENVTFGLTFDDERYSEVLRATCLDSDLADLPHGDQTEIGERGVNLSGGQKQRVNLARAVYANRDIYLLDDTLSAVDGRVATDIFNRCIKQLLKGKTILLVTHSVTLLEQCDEVLFVSEGFVKERGTHSDLLGLKGGYHELVTSGKASRKSRRRRRVRASGGRDLSPVLRPLDSKGDGVGEKEESFADEVLKEMGLDPRDMDLLTSDVEDEAHDESREKEASDGAIDAAEDSGKLIRDEEMAVGKIPLYVYVHFLSYCGMVSMIGVFLAIILFSIFRSAISIFLQIWIDAGDGLKAERLANMSALVEQSTTVLPFLDNVTLSDSDNVTMFTNETDETSTVGNTSLEEVLAYFTPQQISGSVVDNPRLWMYQLVFFCLTVVTVLVGLAQSFLCVRQVLHGSSRMHSAMFKSVLRAPMSFFDATPLGRILNRFARDIDELDSRQPFFVNFVTIGIVGVVVQLLVVCLYYPSFILPFVVILGLFIFLDHWLNAGVREMKRLDNILTSFVIHHLSSTVSGLAVIHSYHRELAFERKFRSVLNSRLAAWILYCHSNRWFQSRMEFLATVTIVITALVVVLTREYSTPSMAGVALVSVFQACSFLPFVLRMKSEGTARMSSCERILEYIRRLPKEGELVKQEQVPPKSWPEKGSITFNHVYARYRPNVPRVLRNVSFRIEGGERVGIIGRTGAGKTTLFAVLLRLLEPEEGTIEIDGRDVTRMGLRDLRSVIALIPQDPTLFEGTIRYNVDPFGDFSDTEIWSALEQSHLKALISSDARGLEAAVALGGSNYSAGERQLLCLTRALLRKAKIIILDEATANVDVATDVLIQETIQKSFGSCTVLTIAHRLNSVLSYSRILVMDNGQAREFDTPSALMENPHSLFHSMMVAAGINLAQRSSRSPSATPGDSVEARDGPLSMSSQAE